MMHASNQVEEFLKEAIQEMKMEIFEDNHKTDEPSCFIDAYFRFKTGKISKF